MCKKKASPVSVRVLDEFRVCRRMCLHLMGEIGCTQEEALEWLDHVLCGKVPVEGGMESVRKYKEAA